MRALVILAVLSSAGSAHAGGGFVPPLEVEAGRALIAGVGGGHLSASEFLVGLSWASVDPHPTPVDFSVGWHGSFVDERVELPPGAFARTAAPGDAHTANGAYLAVDLRLVSGPHWRTWLGGRGELLASDGVGVLGGAGRLSAELWRGVEAGGNGGGIIGSLAIEAWAELGVRERSDRSLATVMAGGLGVRLPLLAVGGL
jgi:hypothetical protein